MGSGPRPVSRSCSSPSSRGARSAGKVNPVIPEVVTQVAAQVIGNDQAITVGA